jgi:hypothetical protein
MIDNVAALARLYTGDQQPIPFKPLTWRPLLAAWPSAADILDNDRFSTTIDQSHRAVSRANLRALVDTTDLADPDQVLRAFTLIVIWGSGVRSRSYRNLPKALNTPNCTAQLSTAALHCRAGDLDAAYRGMRLPGIGPAFFTKWFAFAGVSDSAKRPLILDARVWRTLIMLGVTPACLGYRAARAQRYVAYVDLLHTWADELQQAGTAVDAEQLEYALFARNGEPLSHSDPT